MTALVPVPAVLLAAVRADALAQRDRARGEFALLAAPGTLAARIGDRREQLWRALNPGLAELVDQPIGGAR